MNISERLIVKGWLNNCRLKTLDKVKAKKHFLDLIKVTDEEKVKIEWKEIESPVSQGRISFKQDVASEIVNAYEVEGWVLDFIIMCLQYSILVDDFESCALGLYIQIIERE